jgi:NitT/TauT family transport system ATP-binding protein
MEAARSTELSSASTPVKFENAGVTFRSREHGAGGHVVLSNFNLTVDEGEFVVLVGRSGCGKTTALNLAAGLLDPTAGAVSVLGRPPRDARDRIGYMLARDALMPWRTALRNVEYGLEVRGVPRKERHTIARRYLDLVHLERAYDHYPAQLSQGMRQRVALARTWAMSPRVLLMDEPFAALDAQTRASVQTQFLDLWAQDPHAVLFVTHDLQEAITLADRVVVVAEGRVAGMFTIPFPRPRDPILLADDARFKSMYSQLRELLAR